MSLVDGKVTVDTQAIDPKVPKVVMSREVVGDQLIQVSLLSNPGRGLTNFSTAEG